LTAEEAALLPVLAGGDATALEFPAEEAALAAETPGEAVTVEVERSMLDELAVPMGLERDMSDWVLPE